MRLTRIPLVAVVLLMLACGDTPITDVPDPSFNYMNNPQTGPVVFTGGGSPAAWSTDPEDGLGVLWGPTFEDFCDTPPCRRKVTATGRKPPRDHSCVGWKTT